MTLVLLALAWLAGIALGAALAQPIAVWLVIGGAGALLAILARSERGLRLAGALAALLALGGLRITLSPLHATPLRPYLSHSAAPSGATGYLDGPPVTFTGTVAEAPSVRANRTELVVAVDGIGRGGVSPPNMADGGGGGEETSPLRGAVLLRVPRASSYRYGDRLRVTAVLRTPPVLPGFSYRDELARRGIHALAEEPQVVVLGHGGGNPIRAALIALADRAEAEIGALWPAPESALMAGILLGREEGIAARLLTAFNDSGTRHIIAISGFNITLLAGVLTRLCLAFLNRRAAAPVVIALLATYVALVGGDPAVLRAGLMGALTLLAILAGRRADALTALAASAFLMTLARPWTLWEPSFQLSFAATLGLITLLPKIEAEVARLVSKGTRGTDGTRGTEGTGPIPSVPPVPSVPSVPLPAWLREALLVSLAAQIATLPITLGTFGRLSLVAPLANLLILPAQAAVMELGALATLLGLLWHPLGQFFAYLAWPFIAWTIAAAERLGTLPWAAIDLPASAAVPGGLLPWLLYGLVGLVLWARSTPDRWQALTRHLPSKALLVGLAAGVAIIWTGIARLPDGRLHVTFLDIGQGDAIFIQTPDGKALLIDGGPDPTLLPAALSRRLYPWQRTLALLALTHPDEDHLAGLLPIAQGYRAGLVLDTHLPHDTPTGQAWQAALARYPVLDAQQAQPLTFDASRLTYPTRGTLLDLGSGVELQVLHPGDSPLAAASANNSGLVLRLSWGKASFLLTGDLEAEGEADLLRQEGLELGATVLKVAHHGSANGTTLRFLEAVHPQVAVISVGAGNRFGHPAPEVLKRLEAAGAQVLRTDECGDVEVVTDGERLWVRTGR